MITVLRKSRNGGFSLIELMVAVAIISLLSSVILASIASARERARDSRRLSDMREIQKALELYYTDNGNYPARNGANTGIQDDCGDSAWDGLGTDLSPYLEELPCDPLGNTQNVHIYYYDSDSADENQTYGFMLRFEDSGNIDLADGDGGYYAQGDGRFYETGQQPSYCMNAGYSGSNRNWWGNSSNICVGGN